jgi:hypothetical protein
MPWLISLSACAHQGELTADDRIAIRAVIERQLDAFRQEDAAAAFALASPEIQAKYGSPETFMAIVKAFSSRYTVRGAWEGLPSCMSSTANRPNRSCWSVLTAISL